MLGAVLFAAAALIGALPYGYPDNGDFQRYNRSFVAGPAGAVAPSPETLEEWRAGFPVRRWHRYWILRSGPGAPSLDPGAGTTNLLWLPGRAFHRLAHPGPVLDLVDLAILPRLLILAAVTMLAAAVARDAHLRRAPWVLIAVVPWALALTASSMTAWLNTFFREAGTFTFAALFVAVLALAPALGRLSAAMAVLVAGGLLVATAPAHGPLAPLVALAAWDVARRAPPDRSHRWPRTLLVVAGIAGVLAVGLWRTAAIDPDLRRAAAFNSLFLGLLPLSEEPAEHLERLGFPATATARIGHGAFLPESRRLRRLHGGELDHRDLLDVFWHEPRLVPRVALAAAQIVNRTSIGRRQLFADDAPRPRGEPGWNLWGELQRRWFPRGLAYLLYCPAALAAGLLAVRGRDAWRTATGRIVVVSVGCSLLELAVKYLGDGPTERVRHLVAANFFLGTSLAALLWLGLQLVARRDHPAD